MQQELILFPLFGMVLITLYITLRGAQLRYRAVMQDGLNPVYFKFNRGAKPPEYLLRVEQHYDNLYEQPLLFYIVSALIYTTQHADIILLVLAWLYIATRILHAVIHIRYNKLLWRRNAFFLSSFVLFGIWGYFFIKLISN